MNRPENNTVAPVHIRGWDNISDLGTKPVEKQVIDRLLRFYVGLEDTLPEYIPPISKKKLKQAADDAAQMIALGAAVLNHGTALYMRMWQIKDSIDAVAPGVGDLAALEAIDITAGWPE